MEGTVEDKICEAELVTEDRLMADDSSNGRSSLHSVDVQQETHVCNGIYVKLLE